MSLTRENIATDDFCIGVRGGNLEDGVNHLRGLIEAVELRAAALAATPAMPREWTRIGSPLRDCASPYSVARCTRHYVHHVHYVHIRSEWPAFDALPPSLGAPESDHLVPLLGTACSTRPIRGDGAGTVLDNLGTSGITLTRRTQGRESSCFQEADIWALGKFSIESWGAQRGRIEGRQHAAPNSTEVDPAGVTSFGTLWGP
jgi:hypothetical protein